MGDGQSVGDPVDPRIPFPKPRHTQDDLFLSQTQYHELDIFSMSQELDLDVCFPFDVSFGVGGPVHIVGFDQLFELLEREFC